MPIHFFGRIPQPSGSIEQLIDLRREEVRLLAARSIEITGKGLKPETNWIGDRLSEETGLVSACPEGIGGWNILGPSDLSQVRVMLIGQNPHAMSYVASADDVIDGLSANDFRALWLVAGLVAALDKAPRVEYSQWVRHIQQYELREPDSPFRRTMRQVLVLNVHSFRYYETSSGLLFVKDRFSPNANLGREWIPELVSASIGIIRQALALRTLEVAVVAHADWSRKYIQVLGSRVHQGTQDSARSIRVAGTHHWGERSGVWREDFANLIDRLLEGNW